MNFSDKPVVSILYIINPQSCSHLLELSMEIETVSTADIVSYIIKQDQHIEGI